MSKQILNRGGRLEVAKAVAEIAKAAVSQKPWTVESVNILLETSFQTLVQVIEEKEKE